MREQFLWWDNNSSGFLLVLNWFHPRQFLYLFSSSSFIQFHLGYVCVCVYLFLELMFLLALWKMHQELFQWKSRVPTVLEMNSGQNPDMHVMSHNYENVITYSQITAISGELKAVYPSYRVWWSLEISLFLWTSLGGIEKGRYILNAWKLPVSSPLSGLATVMGGGMKEFPLLFCGAKRFSPDKEGS